VTRRRERIWPTPASRLKWGDQVLMLKACQGPIQCPWLEANAAEVSDVLEDPVTVLLAAGKTGEDQEARVGKTPDVVLHDQFTL